jgi:hypothetical protein
LTALKGAPMKKTSVSSLVKYLFPPIDNLAKELVLILAGVVIAVFERNIWIALMLFVLAAFDFVPDILKIHRFLSQINYLKGRKEMDSILADFDCASEHMDGQLKIGKKYIFGKKSGYVLSYDDMKKLHHFIRKKYGRKRFIEAFSLEGNKIKLCKVNDTEKMLMEAEKVMAIVKELVPEAEISA